jgi:UTP-glucose-1-phosphate uridylyltransferase
VSIDVLKGDIFTILSNTSLGRRGEKQWTTMLRRRGEKQWTTMLRTEEHEREVMRRR